MRQTDIERVMKAGWAATFHSGDLGPLLRLRQILCEVDPTGVYRPNAPQAPGLDLEETQDIPLRDSARLRPDRSSWPPGLIGVDEASSHE